MASNIPVIVQGNSFSLAIPLQIYIIDEGEMVLQDYTPDPTDEVTIQLKGSRRNYTYTPTIEGNIANIDLGGYELADNYAVVVTIVKQDGKRLRSFRTDQFFIVESSDDLTQDDIIAGLEENVIYLNAQAFIAGADGRGIESIVKTSTSGLVDTYTITYTDATTSTYNVTNGAQGEAGATIASVTKTATAGKVDTYTITMTDGNTFNFEVTNGLDGVDLGLANIVNDLTTGGATNVLSAEMGKLIAEKTLTSTGGTETLTPIIEKGGMTADGKKATQEDAPAAWLLRVRTQDYIRIYGNFTININTGYSFNAFWYTAEDESTYVSKIGSWVTTYNGNYNGYLRIVVRKGTGTANVTPSEVTITMTRDVPSNYAYAPRIIDNLTSDADDFALSANQGRLIGDALFGGTSVVSLEQGGFNPNTKMPDLPTDATHPCRVRSAGLVRTYGDFSVNIPSGYSCAVYFYPSNDYATYAGQTSFLTGAQRLNHYGWISLLFKDTNNGARNITPADITATLTRYDLNKRVYDLETPDLSIYTHEYIGELIKVGVNKFKYSAYKTLARYLSQAMAIYGDYIILFAYGTNSSTAYLYKLSDNTLLATLTLPNSTYKRPHCNAVSFGATFNSANSILPLLYVSQWDNDSQKGCLVYDITLSGSTYSANLVQTILPTNVATTTRGAGQTDWVVDPNGYIYSIGYLLDNGARVVEGNKTMIAKYKLPAVSDGAEVVLGDADVLDHFDIPIFIARQDAIFENGRILMLAGLLDSATPSAPRRLVAIDPSSRQIASLVSLDDINQEPEGIGVSDGKLLIGFNGVYDLYQFDFV